MDISEVEVHYLVNEKVVPCCYDSSEVALIDIAEHLKNGDILTFLSLVARVSVDVVNKSCYFVEV